MSAPLGPTGIATEEPVPPPEGAGLPPRQRLSPGQWVRENLFSSPANSALTVVFGAFLAWAGYRFLRFVFVTGRWEIIEVNLTNFLVGRFPRDELYRPWIAILIVAFVAGVGVGLSAQRGRAGTWWTRTKPAVPGLVLLAVLLVVAQTWTPLLLTAASFAVAAAGRLLGARLPLRTRRWMPLVYLATILAVFVAFTGWGGVGWDSWGGLLLNLYLGIAAIVLSFPIGVLLALGRRSTFPAIRLVCVFYIELIRGVPLITLLFMGALALGFFLPVGWPRPGQVVRAIVALTLFTAAYVAEIVRGGLQGVPRGQTEAAKAIGLSPVATTFVIVLPQALRNVIPAMVGQFISLFKDTSLVVIIGLLDLLAVAQVVTQQGEFLGQGLEAETLVFASYVFWTICYSMSRASQRLEKRLGVGER
ncbi:MAG TPA: amino acid ABC transporter permease [Egibacteraceae bacterium]